MEMNPKIDQYLIDGCGRCPLGGTPDCKVLTWSKELPYLRKIVLDCGLTEELKWSVPCYTHQKKNILIIAAFKDYCSINFFKGALLSDTHRMLVKPGEESQSGRLLKFTDVKSIKANEDAIKSYIFEALEVEKSGAKVAFKSIDEHKVPEELLAVFEKQPDFHKAFKALTPGRQRGYLIHFSSAKQAETRLGRIEKCMPQIFLGKGIHD